MSVSLGFYQKKYVGKAKVDQSSQNQELKNELAHLVNCVSAPDFYATVS